MSLTVSATETSNFTPIEAGTYSAVCFGVIDIGKQWSETYNKWTPKVVLMWELPGETIEIDGKTQPRTISKTYTLSINEKANLRHDLASWRGRDFTAEELNAFNLSAICGAGCMISIVHSTGSNGKTYADVSSIVKLPKGFPPIHGTMGKVIFDLETSDLNEIEVLPDWIKKRIYESCTYKDRINTRPDVNIDDMPLEDSAPEYDDDDVPF